MPTKLSAQSDAWEIVRRKAAQIRCQLISRETRYDGNAHAASLQTPLYSKGLIVERFKSLRQKASLGGLSVRELIEEGRRF